VIFLSFFFKLPFAIIKNKNKNKNKSGMEQFIRDKYERKLFSGGSASVLFPIPFSIRLTEFETLIINPF